MGSDGEQKCPLISFILVRVASPPFSLKRIKFLNFSNFHQILEKRPVAVCVFEKPYSKHDF